MRILLSWSDKDRELEKLVRALDTKPHELVYWIGREGTEAIKPARTIFHPQGLAEKNRPAPGLDTSSFTPPGEDIIKALYRAESVLLTMFNRSFDYLSVDERKHFYYKMLTYWLGVFKTYRPEAIIFPVEPHSPHDYVIYELAKLHSIKTLFFNETRASDRLLFLEDFRRGSDVLHRRIKEHEGKTFTLKDLSPDLQTYYEKRAGKDKNAAPSYVRFLKNKYSITHRYSFSKVLRSIKEGTLVSKVYKLFFVEKNFDVLVKPVRAVINALRPNLKQEYRGLQIIPDLEKKFIYAALQVQPERSTSPMGDMFVDQILAVETLAAAIPDDWVIYVKEHPLQWIRVGVEYSSNRYRGYYKTLAKIPKVKLIPPEVDSFTLMDKSQAVMTVAGAPGWEAILRGKSSLIFGNPWYKESPGTFRVTDVVSCKKAIETIALGYRVKESEVITFLKSFDEATIRGFVAASNATASTISREENMRHITEFILKELAHGV